MEILGIIPARGGSKSIPHKNIKKIAGCPLLVYTCTAAKKSKCLSRVILSTDDGKIAEVGKKCGVEVPFMRPKLLAVDNTPTLPVILHALEFLRKKENYKPDIVILLQPTSPLRTAKHIDEAVDLLIKEKADSVVSVIEVPHQFNPVSVMVIKKGRLKPYMKGLAILRRQDKPKVFARNGPAILAVRASILLKKKSLYGSNVRPYLMQPEDSIDIDNVFDLKIAQYLLKCREHGR